jgi:hypothetical protein
MTSKPRCCKDRSSNIVSTSKIVFMKPTILEPQIAYVDKGKDIIGEEVKIFEEPIKNLPTREAKLHVINVASAITSDPIILSSKLRS